MDFLYHTPQTTNNQNISKMSLALTVPKGYKLNSKGKLVRQKKIRILRILTSIGLDTDYDGLYGLLPSGVCGIIGEIIVAMRNHERKVEWEKRLTWSHQDGNRTYEFLGQNFSRNGSLVRHLAMVAETGDLIHASSPHDTMAWWRVHKTTDKTISLRKLEVSPDETNWVMEHGKNLPHPLSSQYRKLTGKYEKMPSLDCLQTDPFTGEKLTPKEFNLVEKYHRAKIEGKIHKTKPLPAGGWRGIRFYKNKEAALLDGTRHARFGEKLCDLAGRWVENTLGHRGHLTTPHLKGFNC